MRGCVIYITTENLKLHRTAAGDDAKTSTTVRTVRRLETGGVQLIQEKNFSTDSAQPFKQNSRRSVKEQETMRRFIETYLHLSKAVRVDRLDVVLVLLIITVVNVIS